ncbi:MAG: NAD(P)H-hydrate dehydratase [Chitinispirillaceae bacterium]|nr:NAD(P)H-hydrate dehydratase [Chitinispirillaceae bacterium]
MISVVTVAQMRAIDKAAIGGDRKKGYAYMLRAGAGIFRSARDILPDVKDGSVAVVCGKGNNGGDGYVAARLLLEDGYRVQCFSLCSTDELAGEAKLAFDAYAGQKGKTLVLKDAAVLSRLPGCVLVIDAMLGTGAQGHPRGIYASAIAAIHKSGIPVIAADTPSGLDCDTGVPGRPCIKAALTVTMGFPKIGQFFYPGRGHVGELVIQELGYPKGLLKGNDIFFPSRTDLRRLLPRRKPAGSKIDHGCALLVCGSRGMTGSAALACMAALRTGCGMTHLAAPGSVVQALSRRLIETVIHPLPETPAGTPALAAFEKLRNIAGSMRAVCIGPGISHEEETSALVREFVSKCGLPLVLDADGINAYKDRADELKARRGELVMTPHRGEWERLFGKLPPEPAAVIDRLKETAAALGVTMLLKGNPTMVADRGGKAYVLPFGNSALAKAGSGDVLSGIIVSLLAQGASPVHAAVLGAAIHGEAGTLASKKLTEYSVIAGDVVKAIPKAIRGLLTIGNEEPRPD